MIPPIFVSPDPWLLFIHRRSGAWTIFGCISEAEAVQISEQFHDDQTVDFSAVMTPQRVYEDTTPTGFVVNPN